MSPNESAGVTDADLARWRVGLDDGWIYGPVILGRLAMANAQAIATLRMVGVPSLAGPPQIGAFGVNPFTGEPICSVAYVSMEEADAFERRRRGGS